VRPDLQIVRQWVRLADHDLVRLVSQLPAKDRITVSIEDLAHLTPYAVNSRYPGVDVPEMREDAEFALSIARNVRDSVRKVLKA
jgi:hypothetical protein